MIEDMECGNEYFRILFGGRESDVVIS